MDLAQARSHPSKNHSTSLNAIGDTKDHQLSNGAMHQSAGEEPIPLVQVRRMDSPQTAPVQPPPSRPSEQNWAKVRARMIGPLKDPQPPRTPTDEPARILQVATAPPSSSGSTRLPPSHLRKGKTMAPKPSPAPNGLTEQRRGSTFSSGASTAIETSTGSFGGGIRGVLGFRAIVEQRTHLRRMEKEIEKVLTRHANDPANGQRVRSGARLRSETTRGFIPGAPYNLTIPAADNISPDMVFLSDLSDTLSRWKSLTVEVPFKDDILKEFSKMLRADRVNPLSAAESIRVLELYERMRALYPFVGDINDLSDVIWLLGLLSREYICDKSRVWNLIQTLLVKLPSSPTLPLSPRNIQLLLSSTVSLLAEQHSIPTQERDTIVQDAIVNLMERLEKGDLALGVKRYKQREVTEERARIVFLKALMECLRCRDPQSLKLLTQELIPKYWESTAASEANSLDDTVILFAQAIREIILQLPVSMEEYADNFKDILVSLVTFMAKTLPPAGLEGIFSDKAIDALIRTVLVLFSIHYRKKSSSQHSVNASEQLQKRAGTSTSELNGALPSLPKPQHPLEVDNNDQPLPSPRKSPVSPKISGENFIPRVGSASLDYSFVQDTPDPLLKLARQYFDDLWDQGFQHKIIRQTLQQIESAALPRVVNMYHRLCLGSRDFISNAVLNATLKTFFNKLIVHQPPKEENLTRLLCQLSIYRRAAFFRPMMACVASDSTQTVTDYLCILSCLQRHLSPVDIFMRDADMMCVIIMTDVGHDRPTKDPISEDLRWGSCTVGQCIIILEFIHAIKQLGRSEQYHDVEIGKMFLIELERKLGMYLIGKERRILAPRPIRVLLCVIFFLIRTLCKTIHRPGWLIRVIDWATNYALPPEQKTTNDMIELGISETMFLRIKHVYSNVDNLTRERNARNTQVAAMSSPEASLLKDTSEVASHSSFTKPTTVPARVNRLDQFLSLELDESVALLKSLIVVQSTITTSEYIALAPPLWNTYLLDARPKVTTSATFLFVKCADVAPKMIYAMVTNELYGPNAVKRLATVERLKEMFSHRNVLMSQPYVIDPSSKGPFRQMATQLPFVPSDVGSNRYTMDEPRWLTTLKDASNFPADIRSRFQEMNWGEKDRHEIELIRREQTPLALLWSGYLDEEYESLHNFGKAFTTQPKSKHAAVVIPVIHSLNMCVIDLIDDNLVGIRTMARVFMQDCMRNEPVLFLRFFFTEIAYADLTRQIELYNRLHALLHSTSQLPPGFAFGLFNHLFGLLRWYQKSGKPLASEQLEAVIPLLAAVVASTNDLVLKDFKRNKLDQFLGTLGSFWFRQGLQPEYMFPTRLTNYRHDFNHLSIPLELFRMALTNINQIHFMTNFLVRYPTELYNINRSIGRFNRMPRLDGTNVTPEMEDNQYLAHAERSKLRYTVHQTPQEQTITSLGALRARMWLRFLFKLFKRLNKNYADRLQLMTLFNGVNAILLEYGHDFGIVGQALDVFLTAATQMRRFFAYQNGYNLIFPALFKIYCDAERLPRVCDTLNAVFHRFYLLHQEAFVLQSLGSVVPLMLRQCKSVELPTRVMARRLFAFFEALAEPDGAYVDAFGLQSLAEPFQNTGYGKAKLDLPQWMASFIPQHSRLFQTSTLVYRENFLVEDACKLFLSVIAFDPGSLRSEQFTRAYQLMLPYFWKCQEDLVRRGFDSLITLYSNFSKGSKPLIASNFKMTSMLPREPKEDSKSEASRFALCEDYIPEAQAVKGKPWVQNDRVAIKHEFLVLLQVYCKLGGRLTQAQHMETNNIARSIVKDYHTINAPCSTDWLKEYVQVILLASDQLRDRYGLVVHFVLQFAPLIKTHFLTMEWTGFMQCLCWIATDIRQYLRGCFELAKVIHEKVVSVGLALGVRDDWWKDCGVVSHAKFCDSLVQLMVVLISHSDMDTIQEVEKMEPSPILMAYFVVPLCLRFRTNHDSRICVDVVSAQFWLRMLSVTIRACEHDPASMVRRSGRAPGILAPVLNATRSAMRHNSADMVTPRTPRFRRSMAPVIPQTPGIVPTVPNPFLMRPQDIGYTQDMQSPRVPSTPHPWQRSQPQTQQHTASSAHPAVPTSTTMNATPALIINFIALRIILVRGEQYITAQSGYWLVIFQFVQRYFSGQNALLDYYKFAMFSSQPRPSVSGDPASNPTTPLPMTPMPLTPFPATPHGEGGSMSFFHQTPQERVQQGLFPTAGAAATATTPTSGGSASVVTPFSVRRSMSIRGGRGDPVGTGLHDLTLDLLPTTSLGFVLWSFLETVVFARLPLFALMRPLMYEQLGLVDACGGVPTTMRTYGGGEGGGGGGYWTASQQHRGDRSANSSGPTTPAFYWPSPAVGPLSANQSPLRGFPASDRSYFPLGQQAPPVKGRKPSMIAVKDQDPEQRKAGRRERRNQWNSWSNQSDAIPVSSIEMVTPYEHSITSMSPRVQTVSRLSRMSIALKSSLQDWKPDRFHHTGSLQSASRFFGRGGVGPLQQTPSVTRESLHTPSVQQQQQQQQQTHSQGSTSKNLVASGDPVTEVPTVLVERANRSLRHVRIMLLGSEDAKVDLALIQPSFSPSRPLRPGSILSFSNGPEPGTVGAGTTMEDPQRRPSVASTSGGGGGGGGSSSFHSLSAYPQHDRQFLIPGERYERPPVSPGFGTMFLAREAALRAAASSGDISGGIGSSSLLPIPPPSHGSGVSGVGSGGSGSGGLTPTSARKTSFEESPVAVAATAAGTTLGGQSHGSLLSVPGHGQQGQGLSPSSSFTLHHPLAPPSPLQLSPMSAAIRRSDSHTSAVSSLANIMEEPEGREFQSPPPSVLRSPATSSKAESVVVVDFAPSSAATSPADELPGGGRALSAADRLGLPKVVVDSPPMSAPSPAGSSAQRPPPPQQRQEEEEAKEKEGQVEAAASTPATLLFSTRKTPQHLSVITSLPVINIHASDEVSNEDSNRSRQPSSLPAVELQTPVSLPSLSSPLMADHQDGEGAGTGGLLGAQQRYDTNSLASATTMATTPSSSAPGGGGDGGPSTSQTSKKKRRSILKPRIITTATPQPTAASQAAGGSSTDRQANLEEPFMAPTQDEGGLRRPSDWYDATQEREGYKMNGRQMRIKQMMESLEEEARLVMAAFPATFVPGYQKTVAMQEKERERLLQQQQGPSQQQQHQQAGVGGVSGGGAGMVSHLTNALLQKTHTRESDQMSSVAPVAETMLDNQSSTSLGRVQQQQQYHHPQDPGRGSIMGSGGGQGLHIHDADVHEGPSRAIAPGIDPELNPVMILQEDDGRGVQSRIGAKGGEGEQQLQPALGAGKRMDGRRQSRMSFSNKVKQMKSVVFHDGSSTSHTGPLGTVPTLQTDGRRDRLEPGSPATPSSPKPLAGQGATAARAERGQGELNGNSRTASRRYSTSLPRFSFSDASPPLPDQPRTLDSNTNSHRGSMPGSSGLVGSKSEGQLLGRASSTSSRQSAASSTSSSHLVARPPLTRAAHYPTISVSEPVDFVPTPGTSLHNSVQSSPVPIVAVRNQPSPVTALFPAPAPPPSPTTSLPGHRHSFEPAHENAQTIASSSVSQQPAQQQHQHQHQPLAVPPSAASTTIVGLGLQVEPEEFPVPVSGR